MNRALALLTVITVTACQPTTDATRRAGDQLACTTVQFIAHPGLENDAFLQGNDGRRFDLDLRAPGQIDVTVLAARNWPSDFTFAVTSRRDGVLQARHQAFNRFSSEPNPNLAYDISLSPPTDQGRTGELRSLSEFRGEQRVNRFLLSCTNASVAL